MVKTPRALDLRTGMRYSRAMACIHKPRMVAKAFSTQSDACISSLLPPFLSVDFHPKLSLRGCQISDMTIKTSQQLTANTQPANEKEVRAGPKPTM